LSCVNPKRLQKICGGLSADKIDGFLRKWLRLLPHPFTGADRQAGYRYDISILQAEFTLTQVLDQPVHGRVLFEQVIRENLDIGRPEQVQLIFNRRITRQTPGLFRTRVVTEDVTPTLHAWANNGHRVCALQTPRPNHFCMPSLYSVSSSTDSVAPICSIILPP
jgi:hypothetical protein